MRIEVTNFSLNNPFKNENKSGENQLIFIYPALIEFKKLKAPTNVAYNIVKSIKSVEQAIQDYDNTRISICESLCDRDAQDKPIIENGKYKFTTERQIEFQEKWQELLNTKVSIDIFEIKQSDVNNIKEINISCYETLLGYGFIKDDIYNPEEKK